MIRWYRIQDGKKRNAMKTKIFFSTLSVLFPMLFSCQKELEQKLDASVQATAADGWYVDDTLYVVGPSEVTFNFDGDPDMITFYSGESGHMYDRRNMTMLPTTSLTSKITVRFRAQYGGSTEGKWFGYLSTDFEALTGDYETDKKMLNEEIDWIDITEQCNFPASQTDGEGGYTSAEISLDDYLDEPSITVAFLYQRDENVSVPRMEIRNFLVTSTDLDTGESSSLYPADVGFSPFHENETGNNIYAFATSNAGGRWRSYMTDPASDYMLGLHPNNNAIFRSWVISNPIDLKSRTPDTGEAIKNIITYVNSYNYTYSEPGLYKVTFVMKNVNYRASDEEVRDVYVRVLEAESETSGADAD